MQDKTKVRIGRLTSVGMVGIEIGRLYRLARRKEIETIEAYRLAQVLQRREYFAKLARTWIELAEELERDRELLDEELDEPKKRTG